MHFRVSLSVEGVIPLLVREGDSVRGYGNTRRGSRVQVNDYEEHFVETKSNKILEGYFGKSEVLRQIRSQSRRFITLEESSQGSQSNSWKRNFTFDIIQTIEFVGGGCDIPITRER